jgi:hypothetical protein
MVQTQEANRPCNGTPMRVMTNASSCSPEADEARMISSTSSTSRLLKSAGSARSTSSSASSSLASAGSKLPSAACGGLGSSADSKSFGLSSPSVPANSTTSGSSTILSEAAMLVESPRFSKNAIVFGVMWLSTSSPPSVTHFPSM